jgi:hypothetical protein
MGIAIAELILGLFELLFHAMDRKSRRDKRD